MTNVHICIDAPTAMAAREEMRALLAGGDEARTLPLPRGPAARADAPAPEPEAAKPKATRSRKKADPKPEAEKTTEAPRSASDTGDEPVADDVRDKLREAATVCGPEAVNKVLDAFGVKNVTALMEAGKGREAMTMADELIAAKKAEPDEAA